MVVVCLPCTPAAGPSPAAISLVQEEQSTVAEEKKKPSDMIKMRLMWRRSVNEKPAASTECHHCSVHTALSSLSLILFSSLSSLPTAQAVKRHEFGVTIEELASRENAIRGIPYVVFVLITHMAEHCMHLLLPTCSVAPCAVDETLTLPPTHSAGPGGSVPNLSGVPRSLGDEGDA